MRRIVTLLVLGTLAFCLTGTLFADPAVVRYARWAADQEQLDFQALVDKFNAGPGKDKNVQVKFEPLPWDNYWDKLQTTILSGDAPDVISLSAGMSDAYLSKGVFIALDKLPGAKEAIAELSPLAVANLMNNGKSLGVPVGLGLRCLIYNKQVLKAAGIPFPDPVKPMTWEQFVGYAKKFSKQGQQYLALLNNGETCDTLVSEYGASFLNSRTHATKVTINTPDGIKALQFYADLFGKNMVSPPDTGQYDTPYGNADNACGNGKIAFIISGPWAFSNFVGPDAKYKAEDYGTAPVPVFAGKEKYRANLGYINGLAIARNSRVQAAAWELVKWMISKEGQIEFTKTGDLPANLKVLAQAQANAASIYAATSPENYKAFFADLPYTYSFPLMPSGEYNALISSVLTDLDQGKITAAAAAAKLEKDGNAILADIWD